MSSMCVLHTPTFRTAVCQQIWTGQMDGHEANWEMEVKVIEEGKHETKDPGVRRGKGETGGQEEDDQCMSAGGRT